MADQLEQLTPFARAFLDDGEEIVAAMTASPRGRSTATAGGGVASMIGAKWVSGTVNRAQEVGLRVEGNMVVVLTRYRLVTLKVSYSLGGAIVGVKEVLSSIPRDAVESIEAKRFGLGGLLTITVRGGKPVALECRVSRARQLAQAFTVGAATAA